MKLARTTILASKIKGENPAEILDLAKQRVTNNEIQLFIRLGVCENVENECPLWVRRITPRQRAALCLAAASRAPIKSGKKFWIRLKLLLNGSTKFRIIGA